MYEMAIWTPPEPVSGRVLFPSAPERGESLMGYIARVADDNALGSTAPILARGGYPHCRFFEVAERHLDRLPDLARVLGTSDDRLLEMTYRAMPKTRGPAALDFFGATVVASDIISHTRRISPTTLRSTHVHRAIWQHGLLPYCPHSLEQLIEVCKKCGAKLSWYHAVGIDHCGRCEADLLQQSSDQIPSAYADGYLRMASLLDPCADSVSMPSHDELRSIGRGACFELGWNLGWALSEIPETGRSFHKKQSASLIAGVLHKGDEILRSWPGGLHLALERRLESLHPAEQRKVLARLRRTALVKLAWPAVTATLLSAAPELFAPGRKVRRQLVRNVVNGTQAMQQIGINAADFALLNRSDLLPATLKSGTARNCDDFDADRIRLIANAMNSRFPGASVSERLGLTFHGAEQLVCLGLLDEVNDPAVRFLHPSLQVTQDSFDALVDRITTTARTDDLPTAVVALTAALRAIGGREKPFGPILVKMLAGNFPYWIDPRSARLAQRIIVRLEDISELTALIFDRDTYPRFSFSPTMNGRDVGSTLNLSPRPLPSAVEEELGITPGWKTLPVGDVLNLAKERIAPGEVAGRWLDCHPRTTATFLAEAGIRRMSAAGWRRHEVEAYFEGHHLSDV